MDPAILEAASAAWAAISAVAVLLLGVLAFTGGRTRAPGSVALGGFACAWSLHVLAGQWMAYAPASSVETAHLAYFAFALPLPYFLVQFARGFAPSGARGWGWRLVTIVAVVLPLAATAALLLDAPLVYQGSTLFLGRTFPQWGPLFAPLAIVPFFLALGLALLALDASRRAATTARTAGGHALLAAGLATFTAFSAGNNLAFYAADLVVLDRLPLRGAYLALFALLSASVALVGLRALDEARRAPTPKARRAPALVALATLVPLAYGLTEGLASYFLLAKFSTVGLWRLAGVGLLVYALARIRMPELTPRSRQAAATALGVGAAATTGGLAVGAFTLLAPGVPLVLLAGAVVPLAALSPSVRLARRALRVEDAEPITDATLPRRIDAYRAALEAALARGSIEEDAAFLSALRERLHISQDVHDALLCIARDQALPPADASHPGYEILRLLGEGAHGRAWLARRRADDALVVVKEPKAEDEAARAALERQAKLARRVHHPRLVAVHGVVDSPRGAFLVLEHMPGGALGDRLTRGPLMVREAVEVALDVLEGLEALHEGGIAHGDVKPSNVLLDAGGRASLADFGLARAHDAERTRTVLGAQGTLAAMAPELVDGAPVSPSADLYAVGALLYRLLTGEHYLDFARLDELRARELVRTGAPRLPHPRVPRPVDLVLARALAKAPADRFPDARAMREALARAASELEHEERRA